MRILLGPLRASPCGPGGVSPPGVSQTLNPTLEALGLRRHKTGVMKGMSQDRNALHGGKQVHGKGAGVFPLPECRKLALDPGQVLSEDLGRCRFRKPLPFDSRSAANQIMIVA